jgi:hypothetical protein
MVTPQPERVSPRSAHRVRAVEAVRGDESDERDRSSSEQDLLGGREVREEAEG